MAAELLIAAQEGSLQRVRAALPKGIQVYWVDHKDGLGQTALFHAAGRGDVEIAQLLLDAGASPDSVTGEGRTPLHAAARWGEKEIIALLLEAGADPTITDLEGNSAQSAAEQRGYQEAADLIGGAVEEWTRPYILQVSCEELEQSLELTFRTLGGNVAAVVAWDDAKPVQELPRAVLEALEDAEAELLRVSNLRLVTPSGAVLDTSPGAPPLDEQLG